MTSTGLGEVLGLTRSRSAAARTVSERAKAEALADMPAAAAGSRLAEIVREELSIGAAPIADLPALRERHFALNAVTWPIDRAVNGLCAQGSDSAVVLVSSSFPRGHQRFTGAHELAHHMLDDPREVIVESDGFIADSPAELANHVTRRR